MGDELFFPLETDFRNYHDEVILRSDELKAAYGNTTKSRDHKSYLEHILVLKLFLSLINKKKVRFPLRIQRSLRPDFLIEEGNTKYGLEIVEAIHNEYAEYRRSGEHEKYSSRTTTLKEIKKRIVIKAKKYKGCNSVHLLVHVTDRFYPDGLKKPLDAILSCPLTKSQYNKSFNYIYLMNLNDLKIISYVI
jgi:hypothetical protein